MSLDSDSGWSLYFTIVAQKQLEKLDKSVGRRIWNFLDDVVNKGDPRASGKSLTGNMRGLWRYRVGQYRVICKIYDEKLVVVALTIENRAKVYKRPPAIPQDEIGNLFH